MATKHIISVTEFFEELGFQEMTNLFLLFIEKASQESVDAITKIMNRRYFHPKRGDYISLETSTDEVVEGYFWDGEKAIMGEPIICIPSEFKIPKEFPITYWDECRILGDSLFGDFCYDTSEIKNTREKKKYVMC